MGPKAKPGAKPAAKKAKASKDGYRMPEHIPEGEVLVGLAGTKKWTLGSSIGVGGFGEIYSGREIGATKEIPLAIKIEPHENGPLFVEMNFYLRAATPDSVEAFKRSRKLSSLGMPVHRGSGSHTFKGEKYRFLVMDRFGTDLQKLLVESGNKFSERNAFNIAIRVIDVYEYIHSKGYVHNDVKAQNILLGLGNQSNEAFLVDFGLVGKFAREGVHTEYKPDPRKAHDGTIEYTSCDAHIGIHARRSDLEILGFNVVHWLSGTLPWMNSLTNPQSVHEQKKKHMGNIPAFLKACFGGSSYPAELEEFLKYVSSLAFEAAPDYAYCRDVFIKALSRRKLPTDGKVDFSTKSPSKKMNKSSVIESPLKKAKGTPRGKSPLKPANRVKSPSKSTPKAKSPLKAALKTSLKAKSPVKAKAARTLKGTPKIPTKQDSSSQTSPGFVAMAKAMAKSRKANSVSDGSTSSKNAAKRLRSPSASKVNGTTDNPTPAMLELMQKRSALKTSKKSRMS